MDSSSLLVQNAQILLPNGEFVLGEVQIPEEEIVGVGAGLLPIDDSDYQNRRDRIDFVARSDRSASSCSRTRAGV